MPTLPGTPPPVSPAKARWPDRPTRPVQLLVEGADEYEFLARLLGFHHERNDHPRFEVRVLDGKDALKQRLTALTSQTGFDRVEKVVVVRDAEEFFRCFSSGRKDALRPDTKNVIQAWLALQARSGYQLLGASFRRSDCPWDLDHPVIRAVADELRNL